MKPITGTMSVTLDGATMLAPGPPHTYFGVAQAMIDGVKILAIAKPGSALAFALVAGHTLECLLKAYLSKDGRDDHLKKPDIRHNLKSLWEMSYKQGLKISETPPLWVNCLSSVHDKPYYLRYSQGVNGVVLPAIEPMVSELVALLEVVRNQI